MVNALADSDTALCDCLWNMKMLFLPGGDGRERAHQVNGARTGRYFSEAPAAQPASQADPQAVAPETTAQPSAVALVPQPTAAAGLGCAAMRRPGEAAETAGSAEEACLAAIAHLRPLNGASGAAAGLTAALSHVQRALLEPRGQLSSLPAAEPLHLLQLQLLQAAAAAQPGGPAGQQQPLQQQTRKDSGAGAAEAAASAGQLQAAAAAAAPGSYAVWCAAADAAQRWQDAVSTLQRGIVAVHGSASFLGPLSASPGMADCGFAFWLGSSASACLARFLQGACLGSDQWSLALRSNFRRCRVAPSSPSPAASILLPQCPHAAQTGTAGDKAGCLLDLTLRLLATWSAAGQTAAAAAWLAGLLRDAASLPPSAANARPAGDWNRVPPTCLQQGALLSTAARSPARSSAVIDWNGISMRAPEDCMTILCSFVLKLAAPPYRTFPSSM